MSTHPFERSGLGLPPYRVTGNSRETYQACPGAPIQPGACCDHCGTGIIDTYWIESADGQRFKVGNVCVYKTARTGDAGDDRLVREVKRRVREQQRKARHEREARQVAELRALLEDDDVRRTLDALPHPRKWAAEQGQTLLDSVEWMAERAGTTGRIRTLKQVRHVLAEGA